jgi:membrane protease subunit HflK
MNKLFFKSPWEQGNFNSEKDIFSRSRKKFNFDQLPNFEFNFKLVTYAILGVFLLWLSSGIYEVKEGEEAVIMRFGKFVRQAYPGLNYRLPDPIESLHIEKVNRSKRIEVGYRSNDSSVSENNKDIPSESIMLTGDENIVKLNCDVMWHISDLPSFMFKVSSPQETVKAVAQSVIREVISCTPIANALSNQKQEIADKIHSLIQEILDNYGIGIKIEQVQLLKVEPPEQVISAYRDVQTSRSDKEREINQAQSYRNDIIPNARGKAAEMVQQAEGYKQEVISRAEGDVKRFNAIFTQYLENKQVTKDRLTLDVIEEIMSGSNKTIVGEGVILPHMQLKQNN